MAFSINKAQLVGNVTKDPELKYTPGGNAVLTMNVATNRSIKKNDQWEDIATFHRVVVWGRTAEYIAKTVTKGQKVYIDGRIDNRSYEKDGQRYYISEVVAENVIPMSIAKSSTQQAQRAQPPKNEEPPENIPADQQENVDPNEIPF